jgi:spermidine synthase
MSSPRPTAAAPFLVPTCFFVSGFAGLALEMVWSRMLALHLGGSAEAVTAVVTAYMGGLGLGSLVAARIARRVARPLKLYALLEIAVAAFALLSPLLLRAPEGLYRLAHDYEEVARGLPFAVRFATSLLLLMVPTFAMGATLPLLVEDLTRRGGAYGTRVAVLYGVNTVGAVVGTALAGFWLLPAHGNLATLRVAAALDLAIAAFLLLGPARRVVPAPVAAPAAPAAPASAALPPAERKRRLARGVERPRAPVEPVLTPLQRRLVLAAFALSGALSMVYELGWTRRLATLLGSSVYSFAIILATFLAGLGIGALLAAPLQRLARNALRALAVALGATGIAALAGTALLHRIPDLLRALLVARERNPQAILAGEIGLVALVLLPAALLLGIVFPLAARALRRAEEGGGHAIGNAYAINTIGTVLGAAGAGLFLLPMLGSIRTLDAAAWTHVAIGAALTLLAPGPMRARLGIAAAIALVATGVRLATPAPDLFRLNYGVVSLMRDIDRGLGPPPSIVGTKSGPFRMLSLAEGRTATVAVVTRWDQRQLVINGKVDASSGDPTEVLLGQIPMMLSDSARRVLVIGYGSGLTTHSVLTHPVPEVETVEIEPQVVMAGRFFADLNGHDYNDPRTRVRFEDGRTHLAYTRNTYDVIISEPSNPWIAGINNLFTAEFYRLVRARLTPGGLFCQWLHGYDMSRETLASLLGTLEAAFPGAEVYKQNLDFLVVWKRSGAFPTRDRLERVLSDSLACADLARVGFTKPSDLFALYFGPIEQVAPHDYVSNTDDNGRVEFRAPLDLLARGERDAWNTPQSATLSLERYDPGMSRVAVLRTLAEGVARRRELDRMADLQAALDSAGASAEDVAALGSAIARVNAARTAGPRVAALTREFDAALDAHDFTRCEALIAEGLSLEPDDPDLLFRSGNLEAQQGRPENAERALHEALAQRDAQLVWRIGAGEPYQCQLLLGIVASGRGEFGRALEWFDRARALNPYQTGAYVLRAATYQLMGQTDPAQREIRAGLAVDPREPRLLELEQRFKAGP